MAVFNKVDAENAKRDADDLGEILNRGPTAPNIVTRLGQVIEPVSKALIVLQENSAEAVAAANEATASAATAEAAAGPTYASKAAGVAATATGQGFAVDNGDGTVTIYLKDGATNPAQRTLATVAFLASNAGAAAIKTSTGITVESAIAAVPATAKTVVQTETFTVDAMTNAETLASIINRTGLTPQMLGAKASDADHRSFIQAAYDRLSAAGGGTLWLPPISGDWKVGSAINCYSASLDQCVAIRGVGSFTRIKYLGTTGNIFAVGSGSADVSKVDISDLYVYSANTRTSGYDFLIRRASQCSFSNIITDGSLAGFSAEYVNALSLSGIKVNSLLSGGAGFRFFADPTIGRCDEISLEDVTCQGRNLGINGIIVSGAVNVLRASRIYMLGVNRGLDVDSSSSSIVPFNLRFTQFEVDRAIGNAVVLTKGKDITFNEPDIANTSGAAAEPPGAAQGSADGAAFIALSGISMLRVVNGRIGNTRQQALDLQGTDILVSGNRIHDMSKAGTSVAAAIYLASTARRVKILNNRIEGETRASYAIQAENAVTGAVRDNDYTGVVTGFSAYGGSGITFSNNNSF
jgi:hypothetical protein